MKIIHNISASIDEAEYSVIQRVRRKFAIDSSVPVSVFRRSIDARRKNEIKYIYSLLVDTETEIEGSVNYSEYVFNPPKINLSETPYIIGMGPAGLFCAYTLALYGLKPVLVERGCQVEERTKDIETFWTKGVLNEESNVQFGEGGAGTFSDGKLVTRISDGRCRRILELFVKFGADEDVLKNAKPHIGTDVLRKVVVNMRNEIIKLGGKVLFKTKLTDIDIKGGKLKAIYLNGEKVDTSLCVLATGNGAKDTYKMLLSKDITIAPKPFSVGFRMEHLQEDINKAMYGSYANKLPAADYAFSTVFDKKLSLAAYTFCMCPGGSVINSSSEKDGIVTNGMSYKARDGRNANSAMLASVRFDTVQDGINFQTSLEKRAYFLGKGAVPTTLLKDYLNGTKTSKYGKIKPTVLPETTFVNFEDLFPSEISKMLKTGLSKFGKSILNDGEAVLSGVETRTSAPLRILRDTETFDAVNVKGLYPCGEGAGYSGGITSSAVDGIKVAEAIIRRD